MTSQVPTPKRKKLTKAGVPANLSRKPVLVSTEVREKPAHGEPIEATGQETCRDSCSWTRLHPFSESLDF